MNPFLIPCPKEHLQTCIGQELVIVQAFNSRDAPSDKTSAGGLVFFVSSVRSDFCIDVMDSIKYLPETTFVMLWTRRFSQSSTYTSG